MSNDLQLTSQAMQRLEPPFSRQVNTDMRTLVQSKDSGTSINQEVVRETPGNMTMVSDEPSDDLYSEWLEKTDRLFRFPQGAREGSNRQEQSGNSARTRWLEANDVRTEFLDAGIGCCWFAEKGDEEPVSGDTEDEAIARLARIHGLDMWTEK